MKNLIFTALLFLPVMGWGQNNTEVPDFTSRVGIILGGGGGKAYGKGIENAPWSSALTTGAFIDWQGRIGGFKTSLLWDTYEGSSFKNGTLSLELLPKLKSAKDWYLGRSRGLYTDECARITIRQIWDRMGWRDWMEFPAIFDFCASAEYDVRFVIGIEWAAKYA